MQHLVGHMIRESMLIVLHCVLLFRALMEELLILLLTHHLFARYLVSQNCIKAFCDLLSYSDSSILMVSLEGLDNILKVGEAEKSPWDCNVNMYAQMIEDAGWLDKIENLQNHDNSWIVEKVPCLLESYWSMEDKAMSMPWDDPSLWLAEDSSLDFGFFSSQGDCDFG